MLVDGMADMKSILPMCCTVYCVLYLSFRDTRCCSDQPCFTFQVPYGATLWPWVGDPVVFAVCRKLLRAGALDPCNSPRS